LVPDPATRVSIECFSFAISEAVLTEERFLEIVEEAMASIPEEFAHYMENIDVSVERYPSLELLRNMGMSSRDLLYGVYMGVPYNKRRKSWSPLFPDNIVIFQGPIERSCHGDEKRVREMIRKTVMHEVGHYFGLSEDRLRELGY
jgi:predicted Zn-dependent protease with MMP-like domain